MLAGDVFNFFLIVVHFFAGFWCLFSIVLSSLDPFAGSSSVTPQVFQLLLRNMWNPDEPLQV